MEDYNRREPGVKEGKDRRGAVTQAPALKVGDTVTIGPQIIPGPGLFFGLYADPRTDRVVYSRAILNTADPETCLETGYSVFREVDGVVFAFREENRASDFHTVTTEMRKITIDPAMGPEDFRPGNFPELPSQISK